MTDSTAQSTSATPRCKTCGALLLPNTPAAQCPRCLLGLAQGGESEEEPARVAPTDQSVSGHRFGDYELNQLLGNGGMGKVYRARQISLDRTVALKMINAGRFAGLEEVARFQDEARAAASLDHPNIVHIYHVGRHEEQDYFTMKFVEGDTLAQRNAACPARNAAWCRWSAELIMVVARALHHAHQRGVMHRDLKPSNILLNSKSEPLIADFGLARIVDRSVDTGRPEGLLGTLGYMAPEQLSGNPRGLTAAVDIHALGCILYELFTGRTPYRASGLTEAVKTFDTEPIVPPRQINRHLDRVLENICLKCIAKQPEQRYQSAAALADDLENWLRGKPSPGLAASPFAILALWTRRNPLKVGLVLLIGLVLAAGIVLGINAWLERLRGYSGPELVTFPGPHGVFVLDLREEPGPRCTADFEARHYFAGDGRLMQLTFTNVPPPPKVPELRVRVLADRGGGDDPARSPLLTNGQVFLLKTESRSDGAFYFAAEGFSVSNLAAVAPDAAIVLAPYDPSGAANRASRPPPRILGVEPLVARAGAAVVVSGQNFSSERAANVVLFAGSLRGEVLEASSNRLLVIVPSGSRYGPLTVTTRGLVGSSPKPFMPTFDGPGWFDTNAFEPKLTFTVPLHAAWLICDDLDGDGKVDIGVCEHEAETQACLFQNLSSNGVLSTNSFRFVADFHSQGGFSANASAFGDVNGDGKPELVMPTRSGALRIAQNAAIPGRLDNRTFHWPFSIPVVGSMAQIMDLDGDGRPEIVVHGNPASSISVLRNLYSSWPLTAQSFLMQVELGSGQSAGGTVAIGDLDGDGRPDIVSGQDWRLNVFQNYWTNAAYDGNSFVPLLLRGQYDIASVELGDIDGDGRLDLLMTCYRPNLFCVLQNLSNPGQLDAGQFAPLQTFPTGNLPRRIALGDLDGDGKLDVAYPLELDHQIEVRLNRSTPGHIEFAPPIRFECDAGPISVAIVDLDGDGRPDLVSANYHGTISILRNALGKPRHAAPP